MSIGATMSANGMVRPRSCPASDESDKGLQTQKEHLMSQNLNSIVAVIGIDIRKNSFHVVGLDERGAIVLRQVVRSKYGWPTCRRA
jgi:hypothetical protein